MMRTLTYCKLSGYRKAMKTLLSHLQPADVRVTSLHSSSVNFSKRLVLGIETSCDDTGAGVVDEYGKILGNALHSQLKIHTDYGGILLPRAQALHEEHIGPVVQKALTAAQVTIQDVDAIAVTTMPGLALSLKVGLQYAKELVQQTGKPMIPIHHMQAHALTVRLLQKVDFPFLVFLLSGGHCLLAVVKDVDDFLLLGNSLDNSPGVCLDKIARELGLKRLPQCENLSGGAAIELLAKDGDPTSFSVPHMLSFRRDCEFSFSGLITYFKRLIAKEKDRQGLSDDQVLPNVSDICAVCQYGLARTLCQRLLRAFMYCELKGMLPERKILVASGGVASNMYFRKCLTQVCDMFSCQLICPPPHLCTDNGIMIAWNGMEKLLVGRGIAEDPMSIPYVAKSPIGTDIRDDVLNANIKLPRFKLKT